MKQIARRKSQRHSDKHRKGSGFARNTAYIPKGYSKFAKMCDHYGGYDWFNSNHLKGIINKYVGKPWDDCYSHLREALEPRFHDGIENQIGMPIWQPEFVMDTVIEKRVTYNFNGVERRRPEIEYEVVGEEITPAQWCYSQGYGRATSSLEYLREHAYYKDYFYIEPESGLVQKIEAKKNKPKEISYPHLAFDYHTRRYIRVLSVVEVDGVTERMRCDYRMHDRWDARRALEKERKLQLKKEYSQYTIVSKGTRLVEDLDEDLNIIMVEEPIFVLKRIKQPK